MSVRFTLWCKFCTFKETGRGGLTRCCERYARHLRGCADFKAGFEKVKEGAAKLIPPVEVDFERAIAEVVEKMAAPLKNGGAV